MVYLPKEYKDLYPQKKNKYNVKKTMVDGIQFDSKKEAKRYQELKLMLHAGIISDLELQPVFLLQEKFKHNAKSYRDVRYLADFKYIKDGKEIVEDVKGSKKSLTAVYKLKKKMLLRKYPDINFREVY